LLYECYSYGILRLSLLSIANCPQAFHGPWPSISIFRDFLTTTNSVPMAKRHTNAHLIFHFSCVISLSLRCFNVTGDEHCVIFNERLMRSTINRVCSFSRVIVSELAQKNYFIVEEKLSSRSKTKTKTSYTHIIVACMTLSTRLFSHKVMPQVSSH